jgi:hypothetical protein
VIAAVQLVFLIAAPLAALSLAIVTRLPETRLRTRVEQPAHPQGA